MTIETYDIGVTFDVRYNLRFEVEATSPLTAISKVSDMIEARSESSVDPRDSSMYMNCASEGDREEEPDFHPLDYISNYSICEGKSLAGGRAREPEDLLTPENFGDGFDVKYGDCLICGSHWIKPPNAEIPNKDIEDHYRRVHFRS